MGGSVTMGTLLTAGLSLFGSMLVLAGVIYTARAGRQTSEPQQALDAWKGLFDGVMRRLAAVEEQLADEQAWRATAEPELREARRFRNAAVTYIRLLLATHPNPDPAPAELGLDAPGREPT